MAVNDFAAAAQTATEAFVDALLASRGLATLQNLIEVRMDLTDQDYIKPVDTTGYGALTQVSTTIGSAPTPNPLDTNGTAYAVVPYEARVDILRSDLRRKGGQVAEHAAAMGRYALDDVQRAFWTLLANAATTAHPAPSRTTGAGVTPYLVDVFSAPVSQTNKGTSALADSTFNIAKNVLRGYRNPDGRRMNYLADPCALIVPPVLEGTARDLLGRTSEIAQDSGVLASTAWGGTGGITAEVNVWATSDTTWFLMSRTRNPYGLWMPDPMVLTIEDLPGTGFVALRVECSYTLYLKPFEGGLYGGIV